MIKEFADRQSFFQSIAREKWPWIEPSLVVFN